MFKSQSLLVAFTIFLFTHILTLQAQNNEPFKPSKFKTGVSMQLFTRNDIKGANNMIRSRLNMGIASTTTFEFNKFLVARADLGIINFRSVGFFNNFITIEPEDIPIKSITLVSNYQYIAFTPQLMLKWPIGEFEPYLFGGIQCRYLFGAHERFKDLPQRYGSYSTWFPSYAGPSMHFVRGTGCNYNVDNMSIFSEFMLLNVASLNNGMYGFPPKRFVDRFHYGLQIGVRYGF
jgi:hypothetical protein